jgi:hypothetical protein
MLQDLEAQYDEVLKTLREKNQPMLSSPPVDPMFGYAPRRNVAQGSPES